MLRWLCSIIAPRYPRISESWLAEQERKSDRVEFVGVRWSWPINKLKDEAGRWNASRLRRRA